MKTNNMHRDLCTLAKTHFCKQNTLFSSSRLQLKLQLRSVFRSHADEHKNARLFFSAAAVAAAAVAVLLLSFGCIAKFLIIIVIFI